jgi:excinuclease ABC subunit C
MLTNKLKNLPINNGIYIMKDQDGKVIYVGKAINLKNRIKSYFNSLSSHDVKTKKLVSNISDIDYIITDNEVEALLLENSLIKKYRPYYNIQLKDDKTYPYINLTDEQYPVLRLTREYKENSGKYFGPYTNAYSARKCVEVLNLLYPIKMCKKKIGEKKQKRACLNYDMHLCMGPCTYEINKEEYQFYIAEIEKILSGGFDLLLSKIKDKMLEASAVQDYETAALLRNYLYSINDISIKQKIAVSDNTKSDMIALAFDEDNAVIVLFERIEGKLQDKKTILLTNIQNNNPEKIMTEFIKQYYNTDAVIPKNIYIQYALEEDESKSIIAMLSEKRGNKVNIINPKIGDKKKLIDMLEESAKNVLIQNKEKEENSIEKGREILRELANIFDINKQINKIEAFDISNISGMDTVGAMVVYEGTKKNKIYYRRFSIKNVDGQNDYAAMAETVLRRLKRAQTELLEQTSKFKKFLPLPDIIFVDGGHTHVKIIKSIVENFDYNIIVAGLKKDINHKLCAVSFKNQDIPIKEFKHSSKLLYAISEEVHRYAYEYHTVKRRQNLFISELNSIPGIGEKRRKELMKNFKSIDNIKKASVEELCEINGISHSLAKVIKQYFWQKENENG